MAFFILPPPIFIADNSEVPKQVLLQAQSMQKNYLSELKVSKEISKVTQGAYKGAQVFEWDQKYNGILLTTFFYAKGKGFKKELIRTATLIRQEDCVHMGSSWNYTDKNSIPFPIENSTDNLSNFAIRTFKPISTVKLHIDAPNSEKRNAELLNLIFLEELSKKNVPTISNVGRFYCKAENLNSTKLQQTKEYSARPHQLVYLRLLQNKQKGAENKVTYNMEINSGVFGQKGPSQFEKPQEDEFNPQKISQSCVQKIIPNLADLTQTEFKIVRRYGSWVYLNRGRAFGLEIGMRLVGAHKAKLHIIRFAPYLNGELDASIAFIRHESSDSPLVPGDVLKLDQTVYPK